MSKILDALNYLAKGNLIEQSTSEGGGGYRLYSDGWKEQWGTVTGVRYNNDTINVTFPKPFSSAPRIVLTSPRWGSGWDNSWAIASRAANISNTGMTVRSSRNVEPGDDVPVQWYAAGI